MVEVTIRLLVEFAPETLAALREVGDLFRESMARLDRIAKMKVPAVGIEIEKLLEEAEEALRVVPALKPVSGVGERQDAEGEGVHLTASSPSPSVSSLNLPGADVLPASFCEAADTTCGRARSVWNDERDAGLARLRTAGETWPEIFKRLNALPGEPIANPNAVEKRWYKLKGAGLVEGLLQASDGVADRLSKIPARAPSAPATEVRMSIAEARQWASSRGLCNGHGAALNMKRVNEKRAALGLPKIVLEGR